MGGVTDLNAFPRGGTVQRKTDGKRRRNGFDKGDLRKKPLKAGNRVPSKKSRVTSLVKKRESVKTVLIPSNWSLLEEASFLCSIKNVKDDRLIVQMPGGCRGFVKISEISPALNSVLKTMSEEELEGHILEKLFKPNQLLHCRVVARSENQRIEMTCAPKNVNSSLFASIVKPGIVLQGALKSKEDHGYIVDLGVKGITGFAPQATMKSFAKKTGVELFVGQLMWCSVKEVTGEEPNLVARVALTADEISRACLGPKSGIPRDGLLPGSLVDASVLPLVNPEKSPSVFKVKILGKFDGYILREHFPKPSKATGGLEADATVKCRILFWNPTTKEFCVSANNALCKDFRCPESSGDSAETTGGKVIGHDDASFRLYIKTSEGVVGVVPPFVLSEDGIAKFKKPGFDFRKSYPLGAEFPCRMVGRNDIDGVAVYSFKPSDVAAKFLRAEDLVPGQEVDATVCGLEKLGVVVQISHHLQGFIPARFAVNFESKFVLKKGVEKMFPVEKVLHCRVWNVNAETGRIILACRKDLVDLKVTPNLYWPEERPRALKKTPRESHVGTVIPVFVLRTVREGLLCEHFGNVKCCIPRHYLKLDGPSGDLRKHYPEGSVLVAKIVQYLPDGSSSPLKPKKWDADVRFVCSLVEATPTADGTTEAAAETGSALRQGLRCHATVAGKFLKFLECAGRAAGVPVTGKLGSMHLSDFTDISLARFNFIKSSKSSNPEVCRLWKKAGLGVWALTSKKELCRVMEEQEEKRFPRLMKHVEVGQLVPGVVLKSDDHYIDVRLPFRAPNDVGCVHIKNVSDVYLKSIKECGQGTKIGTTIVGKVLRAMDTEGGRQKLELTLRPSVVAGNLDKAARKYLTEYLVQYDQFCDVAFPEVVSNRLAKPSGDIVLSAKFCGAPAADAEVEFDASVAGVDVSDKQVRAYKVVVPPAFVEQVKFPQRKRTKCRVVHFRLRDKTVILMPTLVAELFGEGGDPGDGGKGGEKACVIYRQREFVVLLTRDGRLVFVPAKVHHCDVLDKSPLFVVGDLVQFSGVARTICGRWVATEVVKPVRTLGQLGAISKSSEGKTEDVKDEGSGDDEDEGKETEKPGTIPKPTAKRKRSASDSTEVLENGKIGGAEENRENVDPVTSPKKPRMSREEKKKRKSENSEVTQDEPMSEPENHAKKREKKKSRIEKSAEESDDEVGPSRSKMIYELFSKPGLYVGSKFEWSEGAVLEPSNSALFIPSSSSPASGEADVAGEAGAQQQQQQRPNKKTKAEERREEDELRKAEMELMDPLRAPQTTEDFDRLVLSSPNSSLCWIKYMVFHLQAGELEEARAVGRRALKTINFREEGERLNVWTALLNMENLYGTNETMEATFAEAAQTNDQLTVYRKTVDIYLQSNKLDKAEALYEKMVKKFKTEKDVWIQFAMFHMKNGKHEAARNVLARCLTSLPVSSHLDVMSKSAQLELKFGDPERGKTLYEKLLKSCPKRLDLWSVYVDALVKLGNIDGARAVLERATISGLPMKKMKTVFRKYLTFEAQHGTEEQQNAVRLHAERYLNEKLD